jgi:ATP-dependent helicase Lhr and Lhr-like helicase
MADDVLQRFSAPVREWFSTTFAVPTAAQARGWPAIADGDHTLILAPTGSGKTLTAFLWALDRLTSAPPPEDPNRRLRVLYVSPLRALAVDVDRNLRAPLEGIRLAGERLGVEVHRPEVGVRTGDTPARERERMKRHPPDVLITTPESLYLLLTSQARETLRGIEAVIVDEIHALAPTKRGTHLALSLERLEHEVLFGGSEPMQTDAPPTERRAPQRIALSATQRPLEEIARFLGGYGDDGRPRPVTIVDAGSTKPLELEVIVPVEDMSDLGQPVERGLELELSTGPAAAGPTRRSIWPAVHPRLLELVLEHRSTLIFVNARRLAERLAAKLNELHADQQREQALRAEGLDGIDLELALAETEKEPPPELVKAHHGSLSRERRLQVEDELKSGRLRGLVATSSLELGIDMGAVDLVVQVASPGAVSRGLQRIGRAGHQVGEPSRGVLMPKYRGDLVETAVVVRRMHDGAIEATRYPRNPLDVLAQQLVAMAAMDTWEVPAAARLLRRSAPFHDLADEVLAAVLDLLSGRYPSQEFAELRARLVWDRTEDTIRARRGAQRLAVTNPGTIPDRGLFGVFLPDGTRVGELDEEMVHESRSGETFVLGASTWRIEDITFERVVVTPAPGEPGKLPFWHGDGPGRPFELGAAIGAFLREVGERSANDRDAEVARLRAEHDLDAWAADNLIAYLEEQQQATGTLPDDRTIVVERFRDELGDWRVCLLSPFGAQVHAPWAMAIERRLTTAGYDPEVMWADDGIVLRLPDTTATFGIPGAGGWEHADGGDGDRAPATAHDLDDTTLTEDLLPSADEVRDLVVDQLAGTALFTTLFREAAGRALLLPKRMPGKRTALWQQRQRAADLLQVASRYPSFPLLLETTREALQDVFDLPALEQLLRDLHARRVRLVPVETASASPFAQSLLFGWVGQYMYEYDAPLAERRAQALALDRGLLRELLGGDELRDLLDAGVLAALERELQRLEPVSREGGDDAANGLDRRARDVDELHDVLRELGPLTADELAERSRQDPGDWVERLLVERRAITVRLAGEDRIAAAEDASRLRDAIGVALPPGLPAAFTDPVEDPLADLVARYARTHGPFDEHAAARRLALPLPRVLATLRWLARQDRVVEGAFRPDGSGREWVDSEVLRRLKRRSLAALCAEVEPVDAAALGRFLPAWQHVRAATGSRRRGLEALLETVSQLQGTPIPASVLETDVLPARLEGYRGADLDQLIAAGEVVWLGVEPLGRSDGRIALCFRDQLARLAPLPVGDPPDDDVHAALRNHLAVRGASFWPELFSSSGVADQELVLDALWDLVWAGEVTNDTYAPVRGLRARGARSSAGARGRAGRPRPGRLSRLGPPAAQGRWSLLPLERRGGCTDGAPGSGRAERTSATARSVDTATRTALAQQLLERHGVLTRESLRAEAVPGGFSAVYPVLKAAEEAGAVRRGYLVAGLGAAQFALPGAVDRLRDHRHDHEASGVVVRLAATDPAQPYGAALAWPVSPGRPARAAGAQVVLVDGAPAALLERGGRSLVTFDHPSHPSVWLEALQELVDSGQWRKLEIVRIDGTPVHEAAAWPPVLEAAGFSAGYRGFTYRGRRG